MKSQLLPGPGQAPSSENEGEFLSDSLYDYPLLYEALRGPTPEQTASLSLILERHLGRPPASVMDPACGPGTWLEPFARQSIFVAGNDLSPAMVAAARRLLPPERSEITEGDMGALSFSSGPFEAAFEVSGALGALLDAESILSVLESLHGALAPGGVALLGFHFRDAAAVGTFPRACWSSGPVPLASGEIASVIYEVVGEDAGAGIEWVRRTVNVQRPSVSPALITDDYPIRILRPEEFTEILSRTSGFRLEAVYEDDDSGWQRSRQDDLAGERLVMLRRTQTAQNNGGATGEPFGR